MEISLSEVQLSPPWKEAFDKLANIEYGTFLPHAILADIMGIPSQTQAYYRQVKKLQHRMLKDRNVDLENVQKEGYRAIFPSEHASFALLRAEQGNRRYRRAMDISVHVDTGQLKPEEMTRHALTQTRIGAILSASRREVRGLRKALAQSIGGDSLKSLPSAVNVQ